MAGHLAYLKWEDQSVVTWGMVMEYCEVGGSHARHLGTWYGWPVFISVLLGFLVKTAPTLTLPISACSAETHTCVLGAQQKKTCVQLFGPHVVYTALPAQHSSTMHTQPNHALPTVTTTQPSHRVHTCAARLVVGDHDPDQL